MTLTLQLRGRGGTRRAATRSHATRVAPANASRTARIAHARPAARPAQRAASRPRTQTTGVASIATFELRSFASAAVLIAAAFAVAVLYVTQTTAVSAGGYEVQRLEAARDEIVRQNALLEVQITRLDSPARVEREAARLGLLRVASVPVVDPEPLSARR